MQPAIVVVRPGRREGDGAVGGLAPLEAGLVDGILRIDVMRAKGVGAVRERPVRALADGMRAGPSRGAAWIWVGGAAPADAVAYVDRGCMDDSAAKGRAAEPPVAHRYVDSPVGGLGRPPRADPQDPE